MVRAFYILKGSECYKLSMICVNLMIAYFTGYSI